MKVQLLVDHRLSIEATRPTDGSKPIGNPIFEVDWPYNIMPAIGHKMKNLNLWIPLFKNNVGFGKVLEVVDIEWDAQFIGDIVPVITLKILN